MNLPVNGINDLLTDLLTMCQPILVTFGCYEYKQISLEMAF